MTVISLRFKFIFVVVVPQIELLTFGVGEYPRVTIFL